MELNENIKTCLRFIYYKNERRRIINNIRIRKIQKKKFDDEVDVNTSNLIVFLVSGADWHTGKDLISGGILSIASIYEETVLLKYIHESSVIMVTDPNAYLLTKHTQFPNNISVFSFSDLKKFKNLKKLMVHVPEFKFSVNKVSQIINLFPKLLKENIHINILNQRIDLMPNKETIKKFLDDGIKITQTTAHERYSTLEVRKKYGIPLHKLSVYATPTRYNFKKLQEKDKLILVSPDQSIYKDRILNKLNNDFPAFNIRIIENLTYLEYLALIEKAMFTITFGEGLDFYFIETVFSGGVAIATYNEDFFTDDFKNLNGVFSSYESMSENISVFIAENQSIKNFRNNNKVQFNACHNIYNEKYYKKNLRDFYQNNYLFA